MKGTTNAKGVSQDMNAKGAVAAKAGATAAATS